MSTEAHIAGNRATPGLSTGPRTAEGKSRSAESNLRHGRAFESTAAYELLEADLLKHHRPANATEIRLVQKMVQHYGLTSLQKESVLAMKR
jgi:hypothetical protein